MVSGKGDGGAEARRWGRSETVGEMVGRRRRQKAGRRVARRDCRVAVDRRFSETGGNAHAHDHTHTNLRAHPHHEGRARTSR